MHDLIYSSNYVFNSQSPIDLIWVALIVIAGLAVQALLSSLFEPKEKHMHRWSTNLGEEVLRCQDCGQSENSLNIFSWY